MFQKAASHFWSPVPQARKYLDQIREQNLCPQTVLKRPEPAPTASPLVKRPEPVATAPLLRIDLDPSQSAPCVVKLPGDTGELHPKRLDGSQKVLHDPSEYRAYITA